MTERRVKSDVTGKRESIEARIGRIEAAIKEADDYLETGELVDSRGYRPLFSPKFRDGKPCPPHPDWVRSAVLRGCRRRLAAAHRALKRLEH